MTDPDDEIVVIDVSTLGSADLATIDVLARLVLAARRRGHRIEVRDAGGKLRDLLVFAGLHGVVPLGPDLPVEHQGKSEQGEQLRLQEVRDVRDQTV